MQQKGMALRPPHVGGMALAMTADEALDPVGIRSFRAHTGAFEATCLADEIEQFRLVGYRSRAV